MTAFIAIWPDSRISVLSYPSGCTHETYEAWLYDDLDAEDDPSCAKVYKLPPGFHVETAIEVGQHKHTGKPCGILSVTSFHQDDRRPRRLHWSPNAHLRRWNRIRMKLRSEQSTKDLESQYAAFFSDQDSDYPAVPPAVFSIDDVRSMGSFSGIYIAVNKDTGAFQYVGKSIDVTKRVSKSRKELSGFMIAVIKMKEADIHFAELHYIAKCKPTMNREGRRSCEEQNA